MVKYSLQRILLALPTLLGVMIIVFLLTRVIGDPALLLLAPEQMTPERIEALRASLGLDQPLPVQFGRFLVSALRGDFGDSFTSGRPALGVVIEYLGATVELAIAALVVAILLGLPLGIIAALNRNSLLDIGISSVALLGLSMPNFWLGLMLILFFGVQLMWLPISGSGSFAHLILPAITLGTSMMAILSRLIRTDMLDILSQDYVQTAKAKGLGQFKVVRKHALKNALIPTVTLIGLQFGALLGGSIVTETVFAWPGLGRLLIEAIRSRDFPVIQASAVTFAIFFIVINLAVDLIYGVLDPRIRYE